MPKFTEFHPGLGAPDNGLVQLGLIGQVPREMRRHRIFGGDLVAVAAQHPDWERGGMPALSVVMAFASTLGEVTDGYVDRSTAQEWVTETVHSAAAVLLEQQMN